MKLFTLDDALVIKKIGRLSSKDINLAKKSLQKLFDL
jgi:mRNA interferase MazF